MLREFARGTNSLGLCSLLFILGGCSQAADDTSLDEAVGTQAGPLQEIRLKGKTYKLVSKLKGTVAPLTGVQEPPEGPSDATAPVRNHRDMTIEEVAAEVTPVLITSEGYEYRAEQPDYELAKKIKADLKADDEAAAAQAAAEAQAQKEGRVLIGPGCTGNTANCDNRSYVATTNVLPHSAFLLSELGCTATMISTGVAITAAHCVWDIPGKSDLTVNGEPGQGNTTRRPRYSAGVDGRDADPFPFVHNYFGTYEVYCTAGSIPSCTNTNTTTPGRALGCYTTAVPQGYKDLSGEGAAANATIAAQDYAFIDFGNCPWSTNDPFPGWQTGTLNANTTVTQGEADDAGVSNLWGYPGSAGNPPVFRYTAFWADPAGGGNDAIAYQEAEIWGMTGTSSMPASTSIQVYYDMDTTGGQSGSTNWRLISGVRRVMSVHRGISDSATRSNWGRRVDATVRNFGQASTTW